MSQSLNIEDSRMQDFSPSVSSSAKSSKGKWIGVSIVVVLVLVAAVVGILFGLKVINHSSSSSSDDANANSSQLSNTDSSSSSTADAISLGSSTAATSSAAVTTGTGTPKSTFGTYTNPFTADSPWNSRPLDPVFDTFVIPTDVYYPAVQNGEYSTQMFYAVASDPAVTVTGSPLKNPDIGGSGSVTIPHWPAATAGASGTDGHADIYDSTTGIIHSFWQLVQNPTTKQWTASLYSWSHINGTGWGDPAHYYQGPRATGVPSAAGLIRSHEVNDGQSYFHHALTMSLPVSSLSPNPTYVYPATSADNNAANVNLGKIPEGALMMLPASFNVASLSGWPLRKIAETLKRYGAYVTDRNTGTPFVLYVENGGSGFPLSNKTGWDQQVGDELQTIRAALRRVISAAHWVDGNEQPRTPMIPGTPNLLSMRGPWDYNSGPASTTSYYFDTWKQALVFTQSTATRTQVSNTNGLGLREYNWITTYPNQWYNFTVYSQGDAQLQMQVLVNDKTVSQSGWLSNGQKWSVKWPASGGYAFFQAVSGINTPSQVYGELCAGTCTRSGGGGGSTSSSSSSSSSSSTAKASSSSTASISSSTATVRSSSSSTAGSTGTGTPKSTFGTYTNPFTADSPWNSRPLDPVFDTFVIPTDVYYPAVQNGEYSTQMFYAVASDPAVTVTGSPLKNPDIGGSGSVTIPHWPAATAGASGTDGHADIYDSTTGIIHSFWQLVQNPTTKQWTASLYSWSHINGTGWGDPAHYYQGPRATGVPSAAGLIRSHEVNDGQSYFHHALTMSLPVSSLSPNPTYVYPATSADNNAANVNLGKIPEGALMMLPASFNVASLSGWPLRKIAETLKRYGAYVTDRNTGTPFVLYVENGGSGFPLSNKTGWDQQVGDELQTIRAALRRVISAAHWVDGNEQPRTPMIPGTPNLLSMRGPWDYNSGPASTTSYYFDTWKQALVFTQSTATRTQVSNTNGLGLREYNWITTYPNQWYNFTVYSQGDAQLQMQVLVNDKTVSQSGWLSNGQKWSVKWPASGGYAFFQAVSGINTPSQVYGELCAGTCTRSGGGGGSTSSSSSSSSSSSTAKASSSSTASISSSTATVRSSSSSTAGSTGTGTPKSTFGTYTNPFTADSPWNSRPLDPVFDTFVIPTDVYYPAVQNGEYSTQMFYAVASDPAVTVTGSPLKNPDIGGSGSVTIPHWPAATAGASGTDGHADIYDSTTGIIHSFWQLVQNPTTKQWTASLYSWSHINGTGWGDPAHYYQGPRATGVPSAAGLIRSHEVNDGQSYFHHALTMSLPVSSLSPNPTYVYPATSADNNAANVNLGKIPEGALMMLPASFNVASLSGWPLRKIAETLKRYGAYVTDRNTGTPFVLYVENGGSGFPLSNKTGWDQQVGDELQTIRAALRRVISAAHWVDGNEQPRTPMIPGTPNLLSMRGPWDYNSGPASTTSYYFDTWKQALVFTQSTATRTQVSNTNGLGLREYNWITTYPNQWYNFTVYSQGDAQLQMQVLVNDKTVSQSGWLSNGQKWSVKWPASGGYAFFQAVSGINTPSQVYGELCAGTCTRSGGGGGSTSSSSSSSSSSSTAKASSSSTASISSSTATVRSSSSSTAGSTGTGTPKSTFGTYTNPFTADSPWNSRPLDPVFDTFVIPTDVYYPAVQNGEYSTQMFYAVASDPAVTVTGSPLKNPDIGGSGSVTIPHWPAATAGASGTDGHADIYDSTTGIIHSFWQLVQNPTTKQWTASLYSWSHINGTGWGDPAHYYQGPRATGVPSAAGLIRSHEVNDGQSYFHHALTMSLPVSSLSPNPTYVYPATSADNNAANVNLGKIPEGALMMLPASFNVASLSGWPLRKIAETLKRYGAYVTDRNTGTPFVLYVENGGSGFPLSNKTGWDQQVGDELQTIRAALRRVISAAHWVDGNEQPRTPMIPGTPNLLSMRGPWDYNSGPASTTSYYFDTWKQALVFTQSTATRTQVSNTNGLGLREYNWITTYPNQWYNFTVYSQGDAQLQMQVLVNDKTVSQSGWLSNGQKWSVKWPASGGYAFFQAVSGINTPSQVYGDFR